MSLFSELKRRNVFKVAVSYAIVVWIVLQVADTTFPKLFIPDWVLSLLIVLFLLGFPLALFLAWAYEMTPDGLKPTREVPVESSIRVETGQKMNYLMIGGLAVLLLVVVLDAYVLNDGQAAVAAGAPAGALPESATAPAVATPATAALGEISEKSIAVLPFANLSDDPAQAYFSEGLSDELINKLSQVEDLQVTGRTSSFYFKDRDSTLAEISELLGVAHVLQGSVQRSDNRVRISTQLMDARTGITEWTRTFEREVSDIFVTQDEIAAAVTTALSITIGAGEFSQPGMTGNIAAYDEYLQALQSYYVAEQDAALDAIEHIERAVGLDPDFGMAWVKMIEIYGGSRVYVTAGQAADFPARIAEARQQARKLVPNLPQLLSIDAGELLEQGNLVEGTAILQRLVAGSDNSVEASRGYGSVLAIFLGRGEEGLRYLQQARRLDPLDAQTSLQLTGAYMQLGRVEEANAEIERGLGLDGFDSILAGVRLGLAFLRGDREGALQAVEQLPGTGPYEFNMALARLWIADETQAALAEVRRFLFQPGRTDLDYVLLAHWASVLGDPQLALDIYSNRGEASSITRGTPPITMWMPFNSEMRKRPGFKDFVRELGLLDYWRTTNNWADSCRPLPDTENDFECF